MNDRNETASAPTTEARAAIRHRQTRPLSRARPVGLAPYLLRLAAVLAACALVIVGAAAMTGCSDGWEPSESHAGDPVEDAPVQEVTDDGQPSSPEPASTAASDRADPGQGRGHTGATARGSASEADLGLFELPEGLPAAVSAGSVREQVSRALTEEGIVLGIAEVRAGNLYRTPHDVAITNEAMRGLYDYYYGERDMYAFEYAVKTDSGVRATVSVRAFVPSDGTGGDVLFESWADYTWPDWADEEDDAEPDVEDAGEDGAENEEEEGDGTEERQ